LINTVAGMGAHLFAASLVMASIRLCQPKGEGYSVPRALALVFASMSYVIYVLAYVGRDGAVYWLMTAVLMFIVFRGQLPAKLRRRIALTGGILCGLVLLPVATITVARFANSDFGVGGSLLEYYGAQVHHFSDYASMERPRTNGAMSFPIFFRAYCSLTGTLGCEDWVDIQSYIFDQYLAQGKVPWVFGTYVSDFVADFGYIGALLFLTAFAFLCHRACVGRDHRGRLSVARLLLILFYFLTPYWGVFYFRFGIINSFLLVNLTFIFLVWMIQLYHATQGIQSAPASSRAGKMPDPGRLS
jgi:oligosaccharide repeat unit polymerase